MPPDPTPDPRQLVRCPGCGRTDEISPATLLRHMRDGWPECCGRPMGHFTEAERPGTRHTHKCPVCGFPWAVTLPPGVEVVATAAPECEKCRAQTPAVPPT